jgi:hypothetical protein
LPSAAVIDHVVTTADMEAEIADGITMVPRLDQLITGYESSLSDHLPVVMRVPLKAQ